MKTEFLAAAMTALALTLGCSDEPAPSEQQTLYADPIDMLHAAQAGDLPAITRLLKARPSLVRANGRRDKTPLHWAASRGDLEIVKLLIANGADPLARDDLGSGGVRGATPMVYAENNGHEEVVVFLMELSGVRADAHVQAEAFLADARTASCKGSLGIMRSAIANFYAYSATPAGGGEARWPSLAQLLTPGTVLESLIPDNPYSTSAAKNAVIAGVSKGVPESPGAAGGWCYNESTGQFWADTASGRAEASW